MLRSASGLPGDQCELAEADDGKQGGVFSGNHPQVGHAGQGMWCHCWQRDPTQHLGGRHAKGVGRLGLPAGDGENGPAKDFGRIAALYQAYYQNPGGQAVDIDAAKPHGG